MRQRKERDTWTKRYGDWCRRQGRTAQCSPALGVLGMIVVFAGVIYVYRQIILTTIMTAVLAALGVALMVGAVALTVNTVRWYRKRERAMALDPSASAALDYLPDRDLDRETLRREVDWLADAGSELVFDSEGNLHAKHGTDS